MMMTEPWKQLLQPPGHSEFYMVVRPSVLSNGDSKGMDAMRQGTTDSPAIGYGISRNYVGLWMYEKLMNTALADGTRFANKGVQITYRCLTLVRGEFEWRDLKRRTVSLHHGS